MRELMMHIITCLFSSMVCSGILTAAITLFLNLFVMPFSRNKARQQAEKDGRVVEAKNVKWMSPVSMDKDCKYYAEYWGHYEYTYGGKKYKYKAPFNYFPPDNLTLYFKKNPAKAKIETDFGYVEDEWKPVFVLLTIICFVVTILFS